MKKALVLILIGVALVATASADPLTGSTEACAWFNGGGLLYFTTVFDIDYSVSGFEAGVLAVFDVSGFNNLFITADGTLGTIEAHTMVAFYPPAPAFMAWTGAAKMSLGGTVVFGYFALLEMEHPGDGKYGLGATLGLSGTVGDVRVTAYSFFNVNDWTLIFGHDGYDLMAVPASA